jgi:redox-sensitive bicupin YhaK (pirin superfamily)
MSVQSNSSVEQVILPAVRDLGSFDVRRAFPSALRRMVGPFVFLDSFGPVKLDIGQGVDTRPHPHIGLATLTYLLAGEIVHRDSEAFVQTIRAGDVNLMTAGRGIVHSERSSNQFRAHGGTVHGYQMWIALPSHREEMAPTFEHAPSQLLPSMSDHDVRLRVLAGTFAGSTARTRTYSETFCVDLQLRQGVRFRIESAHTERAAYVGEGSVAIEGQSGAFTADQLIVFKPHAEIVLRAVTAARILLLGGEPLEGPRHIFWNFVSSRRERLEQAADDWRNNRFPGVPGETEFIPLPETQPFNPSPRDEAQAT